MKKSLTAKQQRFVEEWCKDYNATQAALRAGYAEKSAMQTGYMNMRNPEIKEAIRAHLDVMTERTIVTQEMIVEGMLAETRAEDGTGASRLAAWKALSDYVGGFDKNKQKVEHSGGIDLSDKSDEELLAIIKGSGYDECES